MLTQPSEVWIAARALRNRMVHEYFRDPVLLAEAVTEAHEAVPILVAFVSRTGLTASWPACARRREPLSLMIDGAVVALAWNVTYLFRLGFERWLSARPPEFDTKVT